MSALNSFGEVLSFAIQLEHTLQEYYVKAGNLARSKEAERRKVKLERTRRENVLEITLEPIEGLDETSYALILDDYSEEGQRIIEEVATRFYADAAPKLNVLQAQRDLERVGKQHAALAGT
jgi:hypothetical protein